MSVYAKARESDFTDDEIFSAIQENDPAFGEKYKKAMDEGFSPEEILQVYQPTKKQEQQPQEQQGPGLVEQVLRGPAQAAIGYAEGLALPYDITQGLTQAALSTKGAQQGFALQEAVDTYEDLATKKSISGLTPDEEIQFEYASNLLAGNFPKEFEELPVIEPTDLTVGGLIKKGGEEIGFDTEPKNIFEKTLKLAGLIRGGHAFSSPETAYEAVVGIGKNLPLSFSTNIISDSFGIPEPLALILASTGKFTGEVGRKIVKGGIDLVDNLFKRYLLTDIFKASEPKQIAKEIISKELITPTNYKKVKPYVDIANKYDINLPPSAITESPFFKQIEKNIAQNGLTEEQAHAFRQRNADEWFKAGEQSIKDLRTNLPYEETGGAMEALKSEGTIKLQDQLKSQSKEAYSQAGRLFSGAPAVSEAGRAEIEDSLNSVANSIESSLLPTSAEVETKAIAKKGREALFTKPPHEQPIPSAAARTEEAKRAGKILKKQPKIEEKPKFGETVVQATERRLGVATEKQKQRNFASEQAEKVVNKAIEELTDGAALYRDGKVLFKKELSPKNLTDTIRSLNNTIEWDNPGVKNLMQGPREAIQSVLEEEYADSFPKAIEAYRKGNSLHGQAAEKFGNDARFKKWGVKYDTLPEDLAKDLSTTDRYKSFKETFKDAPNAKAYLKHLDYLLAKDKIAPLFQKGDYKPGQIGNDLLKIKNDPWVKLLLPEKSKQSLEELAKLDKFLQRRSNKFYSQTGVDGAETGALRKMLSYLNPRALAINLADKFVQNNLAEVYAEFLMDPNATKEYANLVKQASSKLIDPSKTHLLMAEVESLWQLAVDKAKVNAKVSAAALAKPQSKKD